MYTSEIITGLTKILHNMSNPNLPVRSVDAMRAEVEFVNGIKYSLTTGERIH